METVRPVARHSPGDLCRYFVLFISFLEIREFHKSIRYKTEKHYPRRVGRTAPGVERFLLLLMQNWPGRRSYTQIF